MDAFWADIVGGFPQDEALAASGRGQHGWPDYKEFQASWRRTGWVELRKMKFGAVRSVWSARIREIRSTRGADRVSGFLQDEDLGALGWGHDGWTECNDF